MLISYSLGMVLIPHSQCVIPEIDAVGEPILLYVDV